MKNTEELHPATMQDYVLVYSPVILAVLAAHIVGSTSSFRYWLAVCAIPNEVPIRALQPQKRPWRTILMYAAVYVTLCVALYNTYHAMGRELPDVDAILTSFLLPVAIFVISGILTTYTALPVTSVHRNSAGALVNHLAQTDGSKSRSVVYLFLSIAICIGTFIAESDVFVIFTVFASIVMYSRWCHQGFNSLKQFAMAFANYVVVVVCIIIMFLLTKWPVDGYTWNLSRRALTYPVWINGITWSAMLVSLTSFCLRLDYHIHVERSTIVSVDTFAVKTAPPPPSELGLGSGAVIPSHIPTKFSKPYFFTSIAAAVCAAVASLACILILGATIGHPTAGIFLCMMTAVAFPIQYFAVLGVAVLRGEWRLVSQYKEEWVRKPIPAKSGTGGLEEGSGGMLESEPLLNASKDSYDNN
ncbi:hypothetical protein BD410DRAFT_781674 [Rickenella mellea]|uniref:Uncharacterized protein n=1 Tax=Rickenella mellea TaxID=50990 RepID=A0A4Y7QKN5_9AGAM|nr:hypothetical protein BD410DRAFT_781674 [Rickenella mellea]